MYSFFGEASTNEQVLLSILGFKSKLEAGRYRGIYLNADGTQIILRTRNGGGNRECDCKPGEHEENCLGITIEALQKHPLYLSDEDDEFDCTYADFVFKVPDEWLEQTKQLATGKDPETVADLSSAFIERIKNTPKEKLENDPKLKPLVDIVKKIAEETKR